MSGRRRFPKLKRQIDPEDISEIVRHLGVGNQVRVAKAEKGVERLCRDLWDFEHSLETGRGRKDQLKLIASLHKSLSKSTGILTEIDPASSVTLGRLFGRRLGQILGRGGIVAVYPEGEYQLPRPHARESQLPARLRESYAEADRGATEEFAIDHCAPILEHLLQAIDQRLADLLEIESERTNGDGRPVHPYRNFIIKRATAIYFEALDVPPTTTEGGPFEAFCGGILELVGIDDTGLHSAIKRSLSRLGP